MNIRRLVPSDAGAYRALMLKGYAAHPDAFTASVPERAHLPLSWWEARLRLDADAADLVLGAFAGEELAGVIGLQFNARPKTRHKCWIFGLYVDAVRTGAGLGTALVAAALDAAAARGGITVAQLTFTEGNVKAQGVYERAGFRQFGFEPCAVFDEAGYRGKVHMWRPLAALVDDATSDTGRNADPQV